MNPFVVVWDGFESDGLCKRLWSVVVVLVLVVELSASVLYFFPFRDFFFIVSLRKRSFGEGFRSLLKACRVR